MTIRNRIKELRNVLASSLKPNPKNWRTHPQSQSQAMRGILDEIGYADSLIAAEQLNRKCYGMEISPAYCDVIVKRWENLTGNKATLEMTDGKTRPAQTTDSAAIAEGKSKQTKDKRTRAKA